MNTKTIRTRICGRLREARTDLGLTQEDMARELGVHSITIHRIESGKTDPSLDMIIEFVRATQADIGQIMTEEIYAKYENSLAEHTNIFKIDSAIRDKLTRLD